MKKYRKTRKIFTKEEAMSKIAKAKTQMQSSEEFIYTCENLGLVGICKYTAEIQFGSVENAVAVEREKIYYNIELIQDLEQFL
jgi:hypothetical protein